MTPASSLLFFLIGGATASFLFSSLLSKLKSSRMDASACSDSVGAVKLTTEWCLFEFVDVVTLEKGR